MVRLADQLLEVIRRFIFNLLCVNLQKENKSEDEMRHFGTLGGSRLIREMSIANSRVLSMYSFPKENNVFTG